MGSRRALDAAFLTDVVKQLKGAGAKVIYEHDDYGNPNITIKGAKEYPVVARHSVIGGEEIVAIAADATTLSCPGPNGHPFGPIDDAGDEIEKLWPLVVSAFPDATIRESRDV